MGGKMIDIPRVVCVQTIASMLLLSSCGGGNSAEENPPEDDCTPTVTTSTSLELQVGINGSMTLVPVADNSISGCGSSSETGTHFDSSLIETRFETTEDFDVWDCSRTDGSSIQYALISFDDIRPTYITKHYGFEIDPDAEDLAASQQLYAWSVPRSTNADTILFWTQERMPIRGIGEGIEIEWTSITFATEDDISFTSSTKGAMQCHRTVSAVDLAVERLNIPCKYRGPISAC